MSEIWVLERRFRRLLLAYPGAYRRHHQAEILTTLMDAAGPGRTRPTGGEIRDLIIGGLRQRFRLPVGRLVAVAALLSALTVAGAGLALGSAAGWSTAADLPGNTELTSLTPAALGSPLKDVIRADDGYSSGPYVIVHSSDPIPGWTLEATEAELTAEGWRITNVETKPNDGTFAATPDGKLRPVAAVDTSLTAERDGLLMRLSAFTVQTGTTTAHAMIEAAEPPAVLPLTALGGLLGLTTGWLLAARVAYRLRAQPPRRRLPTTALATATAAILAPLTVQTAHLAYTAIEAATNPGRFDVAPAYHAYQLSFTNGWAATAGLTGALLTIALARQPKPTTAPHPEPAT